MSNDKENMWRALKGEEGIMRFRCKIGFHKWSVWKLTAETRNYGVAAGTKFHYRKTCVLCNVIRGMNKIIKHDSY